MEKIIYGFYDGDLGKMLVAETDTGICWLSFVRENDSTVEAVKNIRNKFPDSQLLQSDVVADNLGRSVIRAWRNNIVNELHIDLRGTDFQLEVWKALMDIGKGYVCSYSEVAEMINRQDAVRAVGSAVGANPVSLIVPCHRVVQKDGQLGEYAWGKELKQRILLEEGVTRETLGLPS